MNLPPFCFCSKPAVRVQTEEVGLVYECHYTDLDIWRIRPNGYWHPESHGPSPNPSTSTSLCGTTPSSSPPQSPSIPPSEPRSRSDDICASMDSSPCSLDMDRMRPVIQDIVQSLKAITKNDLPKPCNDHQPGPTLAHPYHSYTGHISNNKISNNNNTVGHRAAGQNNNGWRLKRPKAICGFHLHAKDMEMFKHQLWEPEISRKGTLFGSRARAHWESIFARCHHEIVLKHPQLHTLILNTAHYSGCEANLITVGRWVDRYLEVFDGKKAPLGSAPKCFCGIYMVLSWFRNGAIAKIGYVCALRQKSPCLGCALALWDEKSLYRQPPLPIHPLVSENRFLGSGRFETCDSRGEGTWQHISWDNLDIPNIAAGSFSEAKVRKTGVVSGVETIGYTQEQHQHVHHAWDDSAYLKPSAHPKIIAKPFNLSPLPLPAGLVNIDNRIERVQSRKEDNLAHRSSHSDTDDLRSQWFVESQPLEMSPKRTRQRVSLQLVNSPSGGPDWFVYLSNRSDQVFRELAPKQLMLETSLQALENRIETWQGSVGRLKDLAATLRLNGYDNPTLACRLCKQGLPLRANLPCFHLVMCDNCIETHGSCVICNKPIESSQRIYWG